MSAPPPEPSSEARRRARYADVFGGIVPDPNDPTVPYSQQRLALLDWIAAGAAAMGDEIDPVEELDVYAGECVDFGRAWRGLNPFYLGKRRDSRFRAWWREKFAAVLHPPGGTMVTRRRKRRAAAQADDSIANLPAEPPPVEGKVSAGAIGAGAGTAFGSLILWVLGVTWFGTPSDAAHADEALKAVPWPVAGFVMLLLPAALSFAAGWKAKHTVRADLGEVAPLNLGARRADFEGLDHPSATLDQGH